MEVDSLAKLTSISNSKLSRTIFIKYLKAPNIHDKELLSLAIEQDEGWRALIIQYLQEREEPTFKSKAPKLMHKTFHYILIDNVLYKRDQSLPLLKCLDSEDVKYVLREIHEGVYGNYFVG